MPETSAPSSTTTAPQTPSEQRSKTRRTPPPWHPHFIPDLAIFADLRQRFSARLPHHWPDCSSLDALAEQRHARFTNGRPIRFTVQTQALSAMDFEQFIAEQGRIPIRRENWHDCFNALMWLSYPKTKSALNRVHVRHGHNTPATHPNQRNRPRNFATLLDESGLIIATTLPHDHALNASHDWHTLFIQQRQHWWHQRQPFIIGHGLYEQCLTPYPGLTGKALHWPVTPAFFQLNLEQQYQHLDQQLALWLDTQQNNLPERLLPLPLLGIPGWWNANQDPSFYNDQTYFRPKRS